MSDDRVFVGVAWVKDVLRIDYLQPMVVSGETCFEKRSLPVDPDTVADDLSIKCNHLLFVGGETKGLDAELWKDGRVTGVKVILKENAPKSIQVSMKHLKYGVVKSTHVPIGGDAEIRVELKTIESLAKTVLDIVTGVGGKVESDGLDDKIANLPPGRGMTIPMGA